MKVENNTIKVSKDLENWVLTLPTAIEPNQINARLEFISSLKSDAQSYLMHIDKIRQNNLNIAMLVFAGLFGISISISNTFAVLATYVILAFIMFFLRKHDIKNHMVSHGWRFTWTHLCHRYILAIEHPDKLIDIEMYRYYGERTAEKWSVIPIFYFILFVGSISLFILTSICILLNLDFPFRKII